MRTSVHHPHQQEWLTQAKHCRLKSEPPLMRRQGIHKNIPVSDTNLTLGLRVGFISSHLTLDKLFPVNPTAITSPLEMSLLLEAKSMPALIIKPRLIFVTNTDDLGWNKSSNQQQQMLIQNLNRIVSRPNITPGQILHCTTTCIQITWCIMKTFLLTHKFGTAWAIDMTADREEWSELPMGATTATHNRSETSVIKRSSVPKRAWGILSDRFHSFIIQIHIQITSTSYNSLFPLPHYWSSNLRHPEALD